MTAREDQRRRRVRTRDVRVSIGRDLVRLREDVGLTQAAVSKAAGISAAHLSGIEHGLSEASTEVLVAVGDVLGADLSVRLYPNTGPWIHDRIQARIVEAVVAAARPRWRPFVEVPVHRPARGYIDIVLRDSTAPLFVTSEVCSELHRLEQLLRWVQDKVASLPSADLWRGAPDDAVVSGLLVLRATHATREIAIRFPEILREAYPAQAREVFEAVTSDRPWPGSGILWTRVEGDRVTLLDRPPRGVRVGR